MTHRTFEGWHSYGRRLAAAKGNRDWVRLPYCRSVMLAEGGKLFFTGKACTGPGRRALSVLKNGCDHTFDAKCVEQGQ